MRGLARFLLLALNPLPLAQLPPTVAAAASSSRIPSWTANTRLCFVHRSSRKTRIEWLIFDPCSARNRNSSRKSSRNRPHRRRSLQMGLDPLTSLDSMTASPVTASALLPTNAHIATVLRATASALITYVGIVAYLDRPRGTLNVSVSQVRVQTSTVPGAGLGLFAASNLVRGTILGTYPGVVIPLGQHTRKLQEFPACEGYIWRFSDNRMVIDPTNQRGELDDTVVGGNPSQPGSVFLFGSILNKLNSQIEAPTTLCRINEPPRGKDVNVVTTEDLSARTVTFELERDVQEGEELFIDYGLSYDRSRYGGE